MAQMSGNASVEDASKAGRPGSTLTLPRCGTSASAPAGRFQVQELDDDSLDEADSPLRKGLHTAPLSLPDAANSTTGALSWDSDSPTRPQSGRFSPDERACFFRRYKPSATCKGKADIYWQTSGNDKRQQAEDCWHLLPVLKGKFYSQSRLHDRLNNANESQMVKPQKASNAVEALPDEEITGQILERIFPQTPTSKSAPEVSTSPEKNMFHAFRDEAKKVRNATRLCKRGSASDGNLLKKPLSHSISVGGLLSPNGVCHLTKPAGAASCPSRPEGFSVNAGNAGETTSSYATPFCAVIQFRRRLIEKFHVLKDAFEGFWNELPTSKMMTKKEFRRILLRLGLDIPKEERELVFKHLDLDGDAHVSMPEFMIAVDAAAPVKSLTDLRRRWLAAGFRSMSQALKSMMQIVQDNSDVEKRMNLKEFGAALTKVHIMEAAEHAALFNIILDPGDKQCRVSVGELASAVATVSPALLLEDVRERLVKRYTQAGFMERAFNDLQGNVESGPLTRSEFVTQAVRRLGLTEFEACKVFREIDVECCGLMSKQAFAAALSLCEPSLFLEEVRRKIRQRFRSIERALTTATFPSDEDPHRQLEASTPGLRLSLSKFQDVLVPLELTEKDVEDIFTLIDTEHAEMLTVDEFLRGTRLFAPSCVIEDLRLQCLYRHSRVYESFMEVDLDRSAPVNLKEFKQLLSKMKLDDCIDSRQVSAIFDMLDVKNEGLVSLGNLVAALQAGGPGSSVKLQEEGLRAHAKQDVRGCMSSTIRLVGDLKSQVRQGVNWSENQKPERPASGGEEEVAEPKAATPMSRAGSKRPTTGKHRMSSRPMSGMQGGKAARSSSPDGAGAQRPATSSPAEPGASSSGPGNGQDHGGDSSGNVESQRCNGHPPRLRTVAVQDLKEYGIVEKPPETRRPGVRGVSAPLAPTDRCVNDNQNSWGNLWRHFKKCSGQEDRMTLEKDLQAYYQTATWRLSHDVPLLKQSHSRFALHQNARAHYTMLEPESRRALMRGGDDR